MRAGKIDLKKLFAAVKKNKYVLAVVLLGLVLILLPRSSGGTAAAESRGVSDEVDTVAALEARMASILSEIEGAGRVSVLLTAGESSERVIARNEEMSDGGAERSSEAVIVSESSNGESPVILKLMYPRCTGALIVAEGGGNGEVALELTRAAMSLTGLGADRITVSKMKS